MSAFERYWPDATSKVIARGTAIFGGVTYPANHIVGMGLYGPVTASDLARVEESYRSRGVACEIVVSPPAASLQRFVRAERLPNHRVQLGTHPTAGGLCGLVPPADGITVERVTADTQQTWDRVIARGFAEYGPLPENLFAAFATLPASMNFLARVDGRASRRRHGSHHEKCEYRQRYSV